MLTSFFSNSRPSAVVLSVGYMLSWLVVLNWNFLSSGLEVMEWIQFFTVITGLLLVLFLVNFIVAKNSLSPQNSFTVLSYAIFTALIPNLIVGGAVVWMTLFMLLAVRRIFSLQTERNSERKILDASVWIGIAAVFDASCLLLLFALYWSMSRRNHIVFRQYFIPVVGLGAIALIVLAIALATGELQNWWTDWSGLSLIQWKEYLLHPARLFLFIGLCLILVGLSIRYLAYSKVNRQDRPGYNLLSVLIGVSIAIAILSDRGDGSSWFVVVPFLSILQGNTLAVVRRGLIREGVLWLMIILPAIELWLRYGSMV